MSGPSGKALYVTDDTQFLIRDDIVHEAAAPDELLIETTYSGCNPADIVHATLLGIRGTVIGYDFAGRVLSAPPSSGFSPGDAVAGYTPSGLGRPTKYGSHQSSLAVPTDMIFKIPQNLPEAHAAAMASVVMTAADVVFNLFKFPSPTAAASPPEYTKPILIWGASSSVGLSALQFARAAGCKNIFVTASPGRHDLLRSLGATHVFDYASASVVADINAAVKTLNEGPITHSLDAAGTQGESPSSADLMAQSVSETAALCSVVLRPGKKFLFPVALTKNDFCIHPAGAPGPITVPARESDHWNAWGALKWAADHYGTEFELPRVSVLDVTAEEALEELYRVQSGKRGFGKVVFRHPLK